ncbi:ATP-binding cassette domain-containing protein [Chryseolinea sp. T2]|uniref:ATP-binding cassette domain-containing protein n=1 Tax=Chryseolinea sp. T2 TaxID=3129255 RepID=UPI0030779507
MIEFQNVQAGRHSIALMKGFSWRIEEGENWVIQGPNGSGKTLLLELLAGKTHPTEGEVRIDFIDGKSWDDRYAQRKRWIHYVPTHAVQSLLKQDQHQYYQQRYYSIGDQQQPTVLDLLGNSIEALNNLNLPEEFSIDHLLSVEVNRLSNGQLKKLLLIKVLLTGVPRLMLFDYPFEGLDQASRLALCRLIDYMMGHHGMQVVIVDQHNELPSRINRRLEIRNFECIAVGAYAGPPDHIIENGAGANPNNAVTERRDTTRASSETSVTDEPVVEVLNLKIQYGDKVILENFNWRVNKGERWALVGRNGAGKTTLFSMIFADHPMAYSQNVYLFGRKRGTGESIWDIKRRISYLGPEQLSYLSPANIHITAHEYLLRTTKHWDASQLSKLTDAFHAESFLNLPVRVLSSGQLQVVLIMQCLLTPCELLLLDEPFQFLDVDRKAALNRVLNSYLDEHKTLILITHYAIDLEQWTNHTKRL